MTLWLKIYVFREIVDLPVRHCKQMRPAIKTKAGGSTKRQKCTFSRKNRSSGEILQKVVEIIAYRIR